MKPLIVGEACNLPSGEAFGGRSGMRLAAAAGMSLEEFLEAFDRVNLLPRWPGRSGGAKGHLFDVAAARKRAATLDLVGRHVVLAGLRVASAFGLRDVRFLKPVSVGRKECSCTVVPHPSGIVCWYNSVDNRRSVGRLLRKLVRR